MRKLLVKIPPEMNKRLNAYARLKQKEKNDCIVEALENFLEDQEDLLLAKEATQRLQGNSEPTYTLEEVIESLKHRHD